MINIIASNNVATGKVNRFDNHNTEKNLKVFDVVKQAQKTGSLKVGVMPQGVTPSSIVDYSPFNSYSAQDIVKRGSKIKKTTNDGWVYYADTETLGNPVSMNKKGTSDALNKLNNDIFSVNEIAMYKQQFKNGKPVGDPIQVFNFTSSRSEDQMRVFANRAFDEADVDSTLMSSLKRMAGYSDEKAFVNGRVVKFINDADATDKDTIYRGIRNLDQKAQYKVGTSEFNSKVKEIFDTFVEISKSDNSFIATMNGDAFDMNVFYGLFEQAGININDELKSQIDGGHIDMQKIMKSLIREEIMEGQEARVKSLVERGNVLFKQGKLDEANALYEEARSIDHSMTNSNVIQAANGRGNEIKLENPHVAADDTLGTAKATNAFMPDILEKIDAVEKEMIENQTGQGTKTVHTAINAVMAGEDDVFFSKEFGSVNEYNPVLMESGHSYSVQTFDINDEMEIPSEISGDLKGKKLVKFTDLAEDSDREAWVVVNSNEEIQEKFLNSENIISTKNTPSTQKIINQTTKDARIDKARVEKTNFYKVNSDKGFSAFEMYFDSFNQYKEGYINPSLEDLEASIKNGGRFMEFNGETFVNVTDAIPALKPMIESPDEFKSINERVRNLLSFYDDFDNNHDTYSRMRSAVNSIVGNNNTVASRYNMTVGSRNNTIIANRARTGTFNAIKRTLEEAIYNDLSEGEILESIVKSDENMLKAFNDKVLGAKKIRGKREKISHNKVKLTDEELTGMRREIYSKFKGERFDKGSDSVRDFVFGFKDIENNYKTVDSLDILKADGTYGKVQMNNKKKFSEQIDKIINSNMAANRKAPANKRLRTEQIDQIAKDLVDRKIIKQDVIHMIKKANTVDAKKNILKNSIFSSKQNVYSLIQKASGLKDPENAIINGSIDYSKLTGSERKTVKRFLKGQRVAPLKHQPNGMTVLGSSFDDFIGKKYKGRVDELFNTIASNSSYSMPQVLTFSNAMPNGTAKDNVKASLKRVMMDKYKWTDSNFENFYEKVIDSNSTKTFKWSGGEEVAGGMSSHIVDVDGKGYLVMAPKDRERRVIDNIINGADLEEIKKTAGVVALPKVEEVNGVRAIKQSEKSYKAVTNNIVLKEAYDKSSSGDIKTVLKYDLEDTVDEVINKLGANLRYSKGYMEARNFEKANSTLGGAWKAIHEDKTLNAVSARAVSDGKGGFVIKKALGINRSDYVLNSMIDTSDLVYALDTVLSDSKELKASFYKSVDTVYADNLLSKIKSHTANWKGKGEKLTFEKLDLATKTWFIDNIDTISETILKNEHISSRSSAKFNAVIDRMREVGINGFYTKESGETTRGFFNLIAPSSLNAGSTYSGVSRPLINQTLSAVDINEESMLLLAKGRLTDDIMNGVDTSEKLMEKLGIKRSVSYMTEHGAVVAERAMALEGKGMIGMSTQVKYMNPEEFIDTINGLKNLDADSQIAREIATNLKNKGINASVYDIRKAATAIGDVTALYEDSGAVNPMLASIMAPKTVVEQKIDVSNTRFKVGSTLKTGTVIGNKNGKPIKYNGQNARIVNSENGLLTLQLNEKYIDFKAGLGGSEKLELHAASFKNKKELSIIDEVFRKISGGANIIANPALKKHESFNTIITSYTNAMANNIGDQADADIVNGLFKKHMPSHKMEMKMVAGRWTLVEGTRDTGAKFNAFESFENIINELKSGDTSYSKNFAKDVARLEKERISYMDIFTMQDNTIEKSQFDTNAGRGASLNHRSQSVMGMFIGDEDNVVDLEKYRDIKNGKYVSSWQGVINSDIEQMLNDPKFVRGMEQAHNIRSTIALTLGEASEKLNVIDMSLEDAMVGSSTMSASDLPQAFKFTKDGQRVHAYRVNLKDHNITLNNPIYESIINDLGDGADTAINKFNIKETIDELIIPALDSNWLDEKYMLTDVQKKAADLLTSIHDFSTGTQDGRTVAQKIARMNNLYSDYLESLRYELTDKDGLYKSSMHIKSLFSSRQKVAKIVAPVVGEDGRYKDAFYGQKATKIGADGKLKYYGTVELNPEDILGARGKELDNRFRKIGRQLIDENIDDSEEALKAFKKVFGSQIDNAKDMNEARSILKKGKVSKHQLKELGETFLTDVGIHSAIMRDPAMLSTSYQSIKLFANRNITSGTVNMDAVTALLMNADGDGDEINMFFHAFKKDGEDGFKLRSANDDVIKSLKNTYEVNSDFNAKKFKSLITSYSEKEVSKDITVHAVSSYRETIEKAKAELFAEVGENGEHVINTDYMTGKTRYAGILSRTSKQTIGQISNPNYYLKSAASSYFADKVGDASALKSYKNIIDFTNFTEQSLIDVKSIKSIDEAKAMAELASSYRLSMDGMGAIGKNAGQRRHEAVTSMYKNLLYSTEGDNAQYLLGYGRELLEKDLDAEVQKAVSRILKGNTIKGTPGKATLEEAIGDIFNVLQDREANNVFFSTFVRQSDIGYASQGKLDELQRMRRAAGLDENVSTGGRDIFDITSDDRFLFSNAVVKGHDGNLMIANKGDILYKANSKGQYEAGVFKVNSTKFRDGLATVSMTDVNTGEKINISGSGFDDVSEQMAHFKKFNKDAEYSSFRDIGVDLPEMAEYDEAVVKNTLSKVTTDSLYKEYSDSYLNNLGDLESASNNIDSLNKNSVKYQASKRALDEINIENAKDAMATVKVLADKKIITEDEATDFIRNMNESVKKKGTKAYREQKKAKLLNIKSLTQKYKVTSSNLDSFLNEHVTEEAINSTTSSAKLEAAKKKLSKLKRYDLDSTTKNISKSLNETISATEDFTKADIDVVYGAKKRVLSSTMAEVKRIDSEALKEFQNIYAENSSNLQFQKEVLGWEFDKIDDLIANNNLDDAMSTINASKIAHGKYAGYSLGNLDASQVKEILESSYSEGSIGNIDDSVFKNTREMIERMQNLEKGGTIRVVKPLDAYSDIASTKAGSDFVGAMREEINKGIKDKGSRAGSKFNKNAGKSILDQAGDVWRGMSKNGKIATLAAGAAAFAGLTAYAYSGNGSIEDKGGEYVKKSSEPKHSEPMYSQRAGASSVPSSDTSYYANQNNGVNIRVKGRAPKNSSPRDASRAFEKSLGSNIKLNSSYSDSRKGIDDRDIDNIMSNATY